MLVKQQCTDCKQVCSVEVDKNDYNKWIDGMLIQDVMPYLSSDERELLTSGICNICWEKMFV